MNAVSPKGSDARERRRLQNTVKDSLRELSTQLTLFNNQVGSRVDLRHNDLECFELLLRHGPLSPSAVARRAGVHPATMTGILDRLERGGWVARERDAVDRRAVVVRAVRERTPELFALLGGMNAAMDDICAGYDATELALLVDFLRRTAAAGRTATDELAN